MILCVAVRFGKTALKFNLLHGDKMIRIVTDSSADISQEEAERLGITVLPLTMNFGEESFRDGVDIMPDEFYEKLISSGIFPTTSQASPASYEAVFEDARQKGDKVILLPISRKISGSYECALMVKKQGGYDNVCVIDTLSTVSFLKLLVLEALKLKDEMPTEKLAAHLEALRKRTRLYAMVDTLEYLFKGGRLSRTGAAVGTFLGIKPVITIQDGEIKVIAKPMGVRKAVDFLGKKFLSASVDADYPVFFGYSYKDERCRQLIDKAVGADKKEYYLERMQNVSPIVGVHTGPNVAVVVYVEKE